MSRTRPIALALTAVAAAGVLGGCARPTPLVTVSVSGNVVQSEAQSYCQKATTACPSRTTAIKTVSYKFGDSIGIDVPRSIAAGTWLVYAVGPAELQAQPQPQLVLHGTHYASLPSLTLPNDASELIIGSQPFKPSSSNKGDGVWRFTLRQAP